MRPRNRKYCSSSVMENQYFSKRMPERTSMRSNSGTERKNSSYSAGVQKPIGGQRRRNLSCIRRRFVCTDESSLRYVAVFGQGFKLRNAKRRCARNPLNPAGATGSATRVVSFRQNQGGPITRNPGPEPRSHSEK